jgi:hypothetical protein
MWPQPEFGGDTSHRRPERTLKQIIDIGISEPDRKKIVDGLSPLLADT